MVVVRVEIVEDCEGLLWANVTFVDTATMSKDFTEQVFEFSKHKDVISVFIVLIEQLDHGLAAPLAV